MSPILAIVVIELLEAMVTMESVGAVVSITKGIHREVIAHHTAAGGHPDSAVIAGVGPVIQASTTRFSEGYSIIVFTDSRTVITAAATAIVDRLPTASKRRCNLVWCRWFEVIQAVISSRAGLVAPIVKVLQLFHLDYAAVGFSFPCTAWAELSLVALSVTVMVQLS